MEKGERVRIVGGRQGKGLTGAIFWKGPDKYNGGDRYGVKGDDGETYWVGERDLEAAPGAPVAAPAAPAAAPAGGPAGPTFQKGDRVAYTAGGREQTGSVFWTGPSKSGPGQRLGIKPDDGGETAWVDASRARAADGAATERELPHDEPTDAMPYAPPLAPDELPEAPPWDDDAIARFAEE